MSNVSTRHNVVQFVAGKSEPLTGQRLAKVGYKLTEKMKKAGITSVPQSICVSLPHMTDAEILERAADFLPALRDKIEELQDGIIRSLYESRGNDLSRFTSVSDEELSLSACIAFRESEAQGNRITKEYLENWFTENMSELLTVAIAEKLGTEDADDVRIKQALNGYQGMFGALNGMKNILGQGQCEQLTKIIDLCGVADERIGKWALQRIGEMSAKNASLSALF